MRLFQRLFYFICLATKTKAECTFANQTITFFKRAGAVNTHEKSNTNPALVSLKSCAQIHRRVGEDKVQRWDVYNAEVMMLWNFRCLPSRLSVIESFEWSFRIHTSTREPKSCIEIPPNSLNFYSPQCVGGGDQQRKLFAYHIWCVLACILPPLSSDLIEKFTLNNFFIFVSSLLHWNYAQKSALHALFSLSAWIFQLSI